MGRLDLANLALSGISVGDAFGQMFFIDDMEAQRRVDLRALPEKPWYLTDDSIMSIAVVDTLREIGEINPDVLAQRFAENYTKNPRRGYGGMAHNILQSFVRGEDWRVVAPSVFDGTGSFGNGAAMRAAPIGAYFASDPELVIEQAEISAGVTHTHRDGIAGAVAVAGAAGWIVRNPPVGQNNGLEMLEYVFSIMGRSETRDTIRKAISLPLTYSVETAASILGNGHQLAAFDTVPLSLWCTARHISNYEDALWSTVSALGDRDTTCAITGGLVALSTGSDGIPKNWLDARESLSDWETCEEKWG